ncbi:hypothetical protein [Prosthecomicrobium hirschii]|uniref:hypothetical protein n=1 Tax=Prosthecodimorpha hirschii TaxID=665126 RepID=UPI001129EEAA|nr:hypothetical protein [Prosthecomicrobium hirschii]MCW1843213.1 hypothetical protein [Prosthecomicrobium hirschii]
MTRSQKLRFMATSVARSAIRVEIDPMADFVDAYDPSLVDEIDALLLQERMLGRRFELLAGSFSATVH